MQALLLSTDKDEVVSAIVFVDNCLYAMFFVVFVILSLGFKASYGRYNNDDVGVIGPKVPGLWDWYLHSVALFVLLYCVHLDDVLLPPPLASEGERNPAAVILLAAYVAHYFNRCLLFPLSMDSKSVKPTPVTTICMGNTFIFVNSFCNVRYLTKVSLYNSQPAANSPMFMLGLAMWISGFLGNIYHDMLLTAMKKRAKGYVIPHGGLFEFISGANFFCEIMEWLGFAMASNWAYPAVCFAFCTAANIGPRAIHHHKYYKELFPDYPRERKALVPWIY